MTVESQIPHQSYTANGSQISFILSFDVEDKDNFFVKINDTNVSINDYTYDSTTNSITFNTAPIQGSLIEIERETSIDRSTNYATFNNSFRPEVLNEDFDRIIRILQEMGYTDQVLIAGLAEEIYIRSTQIAEINKELDLYNLTLQTLQQKQEQETINRINGDNEVALNARAYTDFMLKMNNTDPSIFSGISDNIVITETGETQRQLNEKSLQNGDYAKILAERSVRLDIDTSKASLRYGLNDLVPLDDMVKNHFRGLNNKDAWADENKGIGSVAFGRNGASYAYLTTTVGHDCITYGVASLAGGAGAATGNPDVPNDGANYGYCSFAYGKDTLAQGRISNAMGHLNISESRYSSTDGYKCIAGKVLPSHPDYNIHGGEGEEGAAARAHGYESEAYGNFAFAYGSFLKAYNGAQVIGKGVSSSLRGLAMGYGVDRPTLFLEDGATRGETRFGWVGFNTNQPLSKYDWRLQQSDTLSYTIDAQGSPDTLVAFEVKGLLGNGTYGSLHNVIVTHTNSGQPYGIVQYRLNGNEYLTVDQTRKAKFSNAVESGGEGFLVSGKRVVGGQLAAIADLATTATLAETISKINEVITALRLHGLIAT